MDINKHSETQKHIREMEWNARSAKHARMRELRGIYMAEKEAGRIETMLISEEQMVNSISDYLKSNEYDVLLARRREVAKQGFTCPCCETKQIQLVSWIDKVVDLRCRRCKHKFIWESPV